MTRPEIARNDYPHTISAVLEAIALSTKLKRTVALRVDSFEERDEVIDRLARECHGLSLAATPLFKGPGDIWRVEVVE